MGSPRRRGSGGACGWGLAAPALGGKWQGGHGYRQGYTPGGPAVAEGSTDPAVGSRVSGLPAFPLNRPLGTRPQGDSLSPAQGFLSCPITLLATAREACRRWQG